MKKRRIRKLLLFVGIVMLLIGIVIECWLGNYSSIFLLIPAVYLFNIRKRL